MKNLLVYLHGLGYDKKENLEFQKNLANELDADLVSINAPHDSDSGLAWFGITKDIETKQLKSIFDERLDQSEQLVLNTIKKELSERNLNWSNLIIAGRSQGALMSLLLGLKSEQECKAIIPIAGFVSKKILNDSNIKSNPKTIWVEIDNDGVLTKPMQNSYKSLEGFGVKIDIVKDKKSDHDNLDTEVIAEIKKELK